MAISSTRRNHFNGIRLILLCLLAIAYNSCSYANIKDFLYANETGQYIEFCNGYIEKRLAAITPEIATEIMQTLQDRPINCLAFIRISFDPGAFHMIAQALQTNTVLTKFVLIDSSIGNAGAKIFAEALRTNTALAELYLVLANIDDEGAQAVAKALQTNTKLTLLNLENNKIGDEGARAIAGTLQANNQLTRLKLRYNKIGDAGAGAIAEALRSNTRLATLDLRNNNIGEKGARAIAEALRSNTGLATLDLGNNNIGEKGVRAIAEALRSNIGLTTLNLEYNNIGDEEARVIAEALRSNIGLTTLNLEYNNIGDEGARAIAEALRSNRSLATLNLNLGHNNIGDEGVRSIAEALRNNIGLATLNLGHNNIGNEGALAVVEALRTNINQGLIDLNLTRESVGSEAQELEIITALVDNIVLLDIAHTSVSSTQREVLNLILERNMLIAQTIKKMYSFTLALGTHQRVGEVSPLQVCNRTILETIMWQMLISFDNREFYNLIMEGNLEELCYYLPSEYLEQINKIRELQIRIYTLIGLSRKQPQLLMLPQCNKIAHKGHVFWQ